VYDGATTLSYISLRVWNVAKENALAQAEERMARHALAVGLFELCPGKRRVDLSATSASLLGLPPEACSLRLEELIALMDPDD
jgi:hypothetical protein